jgi:hypothetical protein
MVKATAMLSAGVKSQRVTIEQLSRLPSPETLGKRHKPVPHFELVSTVGKALDERGYKVKAQEFAIQRKGAMLFATFLLEQGQVQGLEREGQTFALGLRSGNDKKCKIQMAAGVRVFVCDNGAFSADCITLQRKHTSGLDLPSEIAGGLDRYMKMMKTFIDQQDRARALKLPVPKAKELIYNVFADGYMPLRCFPQVHENYFAPTPEMTDCRGETLWALHNAFTREVRSMAPAPAFRATTRLGALLAGRGLN